VLPQVPLEINDDLTLEERLIQILDRSEKKLQNKRIPVRGLGAGRANEGTLPRIRRRWTAAETNSAGSVQGSVQVFELATWHGRGA
jgi:hypothetical protein